MQHLVADELLCGGNGLVHAHTQIREVLQVLAIFVLSHKRNEGINFFGTDVFLQKFPVVVQQCRYRVLSQDVVSYLSLHELKLARNVLLKIVSNNRRKRIEIYLNVRVKIESVDMS